MHPVNLDLLHASARHHPDGRPKDLHAQHRAEHIATLRAARRGRWLVGLKRLRKALAFGASVPTSLAQPCRSQKG